MLFTIKKEDYSPAEYIYQLTQYLIDRTAEDDLGMPTVSDEYWDKLYYELKQLEEETGIYYPNSPTRSINYTNKNNQSTVKHDHLMLSLDKTKDIEVVRSFLGNKECVAMCKMDGLTCTLKYINGKLVSAETRGDGFAGVDVLDHIKHVKNIPQAIAYKEELVVDGEIICKINDFAPYKAEFSTPRNFAIGTLNLTKDQDSASRPLCFVAWELIKGYNHLTQFEQKLNTLRVEGFETVPWITNPATLESAAEELRSIAEAKKYPIDGVVYKFNDIAYGNSCGRTKHHFKNAIAFKFYDDTYATTLRNIIWQPNGRNGKIVPVAIFDPVEIDGTNVSRASLYNANKMLEILGSPYIGQTISVQKSNMIIPTVVWADKVCPPDAVKLEIPRVCPLCGAAIEKNNVDIFCTNPDCNGQLLSKLEHFRKTINIKGVSRKTLEKFVEQGWVNSYADLMNFERFSMSCRELEGFTIKVISNITNAIEAARNVDLATFLTAINIPTIGKAAAETLANEFGSYKSFREAVKQQKDFTYIDNIGPTTGDILLKHDYTMADEVYPLLTITHKEKQLKQGDACKGQTVLISGRLSLFNNRTELENAIRAQGGKVVVKFTNNVTILINNYPERKTLKQQEAESRGVQILTEEAFCHKFNIAPGKERYFQ